MKTRTKLYYTLLALLLPLLFFGQSITGKVTDQLDVIPFADVVIKDNNLNILSGTTTNDDGTFKLKLNKGTYIIEISYLGYDTYTNEFNLVGDLDLGTIVLIENAENLDEVVLKAEKRLLERKIDRLVFNVSKSIASTGGNAVDVINITPGIRIQNGELSILGKGATQVMINGRLSPLAGDELISFLSGFSADDIDKIEVITNPPAKYDASGNGGLINIILKKGVRDSWKNSTNLSYNQNRYNFTSLSNNFSYNKNRLSLIASINASLGSMENLESVEINYPDNFWNTRIDAEIGRDQLSGRFLLDYELSDKLTIGAQYLTNTTKPNIDAVTTSNIFNTTGNLESSLENLGMNTVDNQNHSINFHAVRQLDTLGKSISVDVDYFNFKSDNTLNFSTEQFNAEGVSQGFSSSALNIADQNIENFSSQIDVEFPLEKINLFYGVKASFTNTNSGVLYFDTITGESILDPTQSNDFEYEENVLSAYVSGQTKISNKLNLKFGLRFEDTQTTGINAEINEENSIDYSKFFPTLYLAYDKDDNNSFGFNYGRRISRPNFRDLNPFRFYINDNSYSVGNPFLQPSFSDNFEVSHIYKNNFKTTLSLTAITDGFGVVFNTDAVNQDQIITRDNYFTKYIYRLEESFSYNKVSWWKSQNSINLLAYITELSMDFNAEVNDGLQFYAESNNTFILSDQTKLQALVWYSSYHNDGIFSVGEMFHLSIGMQHEFKNNIKLSVLFSDILNTGSLRDYNSTVNAIEQSYSQNTSSRNLRISLSYQFGNKKVNVKNRAFSNDTEQMRSN